MDERFLVVVASLLTIGAGVWLLNPLVRALAERIRPRAPTLDPGAEEFREAVLSELQEVRREVAELGERMDFAERLIARQAEPSRLGPGREG